MSGQIEARAEHPVAANKVLLMHGDRTLDLSPVPRRVGAHGPFSPAPPRRASTTPDPGHVAMLLDNHLELLALYGGCAYAGLTLFGVNTGLRGEVLAGVLNQSRARLLVVDERLLPEIERVRRRAAHLAPENILVLGTQGGGTAAAAPTCAPASMRRSAARRRSLDAPGVDVPPDRNLMVIYTSGTTGLPKGINNNHLKLCATGMGVSANMELGAATTSATPACRCSIRTPCSSASCRRSGSAAPSGCANASAPASSSRTSSATA